MVFSKARLGFLAALCALLPLLHFPGAQSAAVPARKFAGHASNLVIDDSNLVHAQRFFSAPRNSKNMKVVSNRFMKVSLFTKMRCRGDLLTRRQIPSSPCQTSSSTTFSAVGTLILPTKTNQRFIASPIAPARLVMGTRRHSGWANGQQMVHPAKWRSR